MKTPDKGGPAVGTAGCTSPPNDASGESASAGERDGRGLLDHERMESWTIKHFSQANPAGTGQDDVPALLRRVADSIESLGSVEVQDLVMHTEVTAEGGWPSLTVYFSDAED